MTTQKYKSLLVIIWALWAFHPCLAIDDVLRTAKRDAILAQITGKYHDYFTILRATM